MPGDQLRTVWGNVESFCSNGSELAGIDCERIVEFLGDPDSVRSDAYGKVYTYRPGNNISHITADFPNSSETVSEIFVIFD